MLLQALVREGHASEARELQSRLIPLARTIGGQARRAGAQSRAQPHGLRGGAPRPPPSGALGGRRWHNSQSLGLLERVGA